MPSTPPVAILLQRDDVRRVRALLGRRDDAIVALTDCNGNTVWVSHPGVHKLLGCTPDGILGSDPIDHVHPDDRDRVAAAIKHARAGESSIDLMHRIRRLDGNWLTVRTIAWPTDPVPGPSAVHIVIAERTATPRPTSGPAVTGR